jgi:MFS family permease
MSLGEAELAAAAPIDLAQQADTRSLRERLVPVVLVGANILNMFAVVTLSPSIALIGRHFTGNSDLGPLALIFGSNGGGALVAQLMITLLGIGNMVGGPIAGFLAARIGNRNLLSLALILFTATGVAGLLVDAPLSFLAARFLQGIACAAILVAIMSIIGDRYQGEARAKFLGLQGAIVSASGFVALFLGGEVAEWGGWRAPFALFVPAILMLPLALFALPPTPPKRAESAAGGWGVLLKLWPFYLMLIPFYMAAYMTTVHLSFVLAGDGVTRPQSQGLIMTASMVFNIIGAMSYGALMAKLGRRWVFVIILGIFGASDLTIGLLANAVGSTAGCWVAGLAGGLMTPFFTNAILDRTGAAMRGRALGLMYATMYIGDFLNPFAMTPLRLQIGNHPTFAVVGAALAAVTLLQALSRRSPVGD